MTDGFAVGYSAPMRAHHTISPNHPSASLNKEFITAYLQRCTDAGETAGPFPSPPFPVMHISGVGVVPKRNGKLRLIHDLSSPEGTSVNDGISRTDFSLEYTTIDRLCPVREADWHLLGIHWEGQFYHDRVLPFGLRSAPYIFNCLAESVEWILRDSGRIRDIIHYLDDFLNVSAASRSLADKQRSVILDLFQYLNVPVAPEKVEGPTTTLTFLGIELDTLQLEMRIPADKRQDLLRIIGSLLTHRSTTRRELVSVLGKLSFIARALPSGRTFLRRLYDLSKATVHKPKHSVLRLPEAACEDLSWWADALHAWRGRSFFLMDAWTPSPDLELQTDASGTIGYGAYYAGRWIHGTWSEVESAHSIEYKELFAIIGHVTLGTCHVTYPFSIPCVHEA